MKILVMGAGALGSAVGGFLAKAGHDVTLVGRNPHMESIGEEGLTISGIWGNHKIENLTTQTNMDGLSSFDLILVTTKSPDTEKAAKELVGRGSIIISLQNGVGNEEILQKQLGKEKVLGGMVIIGFVITQPGKVKVTVMADKIKIGEMNGEKSPRLQKIVDMFNAANLPTEAVGNIQQWLWGKLFYNACLNPLGAILEVKYGKLAN